MSKRNHASVQHLPPARLPVQTREKPPVAVQTKQGIELHCPFCADHHLLLPGKESTCGTHIEVSAVQEVIGARFSKAENLVCLKCHKSGGEMVHYHSGFVHLVDCAPETRLLQEPPRFNPLAGFVFKLHPRVRGIVERLTGRADQVLEIDQFGNATGKILGYFFWKGNHAKHSPAPTRQPVS